MPEDLKKFEALLAEWTGWNCTIRRLTFEIEDEDDALEVAEDIALLEATADRTGHLIKSKINRDATLLDTPTTSFFPDPLIAPTRPSP
jgi:hypothetical protein